MACDTRPIGNQTLTQRKAQVRDVVTKLAADLAAGKIKAVVGPQGAIAFAGWQDRANVSDACAYRLLQVFGSPLAKAKIAQAEALAGRSVNRQIIGAGVHSHDGGHSFHPGHKHHGH